MYREITLSADAIMQIYDLYRDNKIFLEKDDAEELELVVEGIAYEEQVNRDLEF